MAFSYERQKSYTGKVQYRIDGNAVVTANGKPWKRGEVKDVAKSVYADGLVASGNFAHVPADTPVGVPGADDGAQTEVAETALTSRVRGFLAEREPNSLPPDAERRVRELLDASVASDQVGPDATQEVKFENSVLRREISEELDQIAAANPQTATEEQE